MKHIIELQGMMRSREDDVMRLVDFSLRINASGSQNLLSSVCAYLWLQIVLKSIFYSITIFSIIVRKIFAFYRKGYVITIKNEIILSSLGVFGVSRKVFHLVLQFGAS